MADLNALIMEQFHDIGQTISELKQSMHDLRGDMLDLREQLHGMRGDALRQEKILLSLSQKIERIETHPVLQNL